jgi:hypothetical protein
MTDGTDTAVRVDGLRRDKQSVVFVFSLPLGARPDRAGATGLDCRRIGAVPDDLPLAQQPGRLTMTDASQDVLEGGLLRWDVFNGLVLAGTVVLVWTDWPSVAQRIVATAALAAMAALYMLAGRWLMLAEADTRGGLAYLAALIALFAVAHSRTRLRTRPAAAPTSRSAGRPGRWRRAPR